MCGRLFSPCLSRRPAPQPGAAVAPTPGRGLDPRRARDRTARPARYQPQFATGGTRNSYEYFKYASPPLTPSARPGLAARFLRVTFRFALGVVFPFFIVFLLGSADPSSPTLHVRPGPVTHLLAAPHPHDAIPVRQVLQPEDSTYYLLSSGVCAPPRSALTLMKIARGAPARSLVLTARFPGPLAERPTVRWPECTTSTVSFGDYPFP
jgi:hypothetical protein